MGLSFFGFLIPLIEGRLGINEYNLAKPRTFAKRFSFAKLYGFCQIVYSFAELSANAVEIWEICYFV